MKLTLFVMLLAVELFFSHPAQGRFVRDDRKLSREADEEASLTSIGFTGDWNEIVLGQLGVGEPFKVIYDGSRLPGRQHRIIIVLFKFGDQGEVYEQLLEGPLKLDDKEMYSRTLFMRYGAKKLVIWFKCLDEGVVTWDSDYGKNYHFEITKPSIVFDKDWGETVHGAIEAGKQFDIFYNSNRLGDENYLQMKFSNDGEVSTEKLQGLGDETTYQTASVDVPEDAEEVILWFYSENGDGDKVWDSDYGKNYHFQLTSE